MSVSHADTVIVLDFETTGLSPQQGDRAIEIGAVKLENGIITDRFQQLMNPGFRVTSFIEQYTGISNEMLSQAPNCKTVMADFSDFIGNSSLVAHNASFDQRFLIAELNRLHRPFNTSFACSMLIARRVFPEAANHQLGTLVAHTNIEHDGVFHRALADAEMTAQLWLKILQKLQQQWPALTVSFELMQQLQQQPKGALDRFIKRQLAT
ncbi:3'-5' exonuclease [Shewanella colwelliana]|uniref:3'-5' exonuclease n=1 Tax=Shewanella colwelliana TaxID=23 RepID=UPI003CFC0657